MLKRKIGIGICATATLGVVAWSPLASAAAASAAHTARPAVIKITGTSIAAALAKRTAAVSPQMAKAEKAFTALESVTRAPAAAINCFGNVAIQSDENGAFVSEEQDYSGANAHMLRARAATVGPWELYSTCRDESSGLTLIMSQEDNLYVSEEQNYSGANRFMLRARAMTAGSFETFYTNVDPCGGCTVAFQSGENNAYVSEEQNYSGASRFMLRARASAIGPFETFNW